MIQLSWPIATVNSFGNFFGNHHHHRNESVPLFNLDSIQSGYSATGCGKLLRLLRHALLPLQPPPPHNTGETYNFCPLSTTGRSLPFQLVKTAPNSKLNSAAGNFLTERRKICEKALYRNSPFPRGPSPLALKWPLYSHFYTQQSIKSGFILPPSHGDSLKRPPSPRPPTPSNRFIANINISRSELNESGIPGVNVDVGLRPHPSERRAGPAGDDCELWTLFRTCHKHTRTVTGSVGWEGSRAVQN